MPDSSYEDSEEALEKILKLEGWDFSAGVAKWTGMADLRTEDAACIKDEDHKKAALAAKHDLYALVTAELHAAQEPLERLLKEAQNKRRRLTGEEYEEIADAHGRAWHAARAYNGVATLLVGHHMRR